MDVVCRSAQPGRADRVVQLGPRETLFSALRREDQPIAGSCTAFLVCGKCRVRVLEGAELCNAPDAEEQAVLLREGAAREERLACRLRARGGGGPLVVSAGYW
jgi:ferredoxin